MDRRSFILSLAALPASGSTAVAAPRGLILSKAQREAGRALLARAPSVDIHTHAGRFFIEADASQNTALGAQLGPPFGPRAVSQAHAARLGATWLSAVADYRVLATSPEGLRAYRGFEAGEAIADYRRQIAVLKALAATAGMTIASDRQAVETAWRGGQTAALFAIEGGDFIEDQIARVASAHADGVRSITIVHYRINTIGDIQTQPAVHGGLTRFGRRVVVEMNRVGVVIDLSHASANVVRQAVDLSIHPMILSHSNLLTPGQSHPRLVSPEEARLVARHGGVVGALPAGAGIDNFGDFIFMILRMVDQLGVDHVAVGTDMDFTFKSVVPTYADWSLIPAALLAHGMSQDEAIKIMGGNILRVLDAVGARANQRRT